MDQLKEALLTLDVEDDEHWTEDGLPVVQVIADMVGDEDLTREDITEAAPEFGREALRKIRETAEDLEDEDLPADTNVEVTIDAQLRDVDNEINELNEQLVELNQAIKEASQKRSRLAALAAKQRNEGSNQQAIRAAIDRSNQQRAARVKQHQEAMGKLTGVSLNPLSPYEQARAAQGKSNPQPPRIPVQQ